VSRYAENTRVSSEQSRAEIERILSRYGADGFMYGWADQNALIAFQMRERRIKFILPMPAKDLPEFVFTPARRSRRSPDEQLREWEQACRQRWRALAIAIKAKLECVESGITSFEEEFMAHIVLPNGKTVGSWMQPQIETSYKNGKMPPLLGGPV